MVYLWVSNPSAGNIIVSLFGVMNNALYAKTKMYANQRLLLHFDEIEHDRTGRSKKTNSNM